MGDKVKVTYKGKAFVRGWKPAEERELPASEANQYDNPRAKALGFKVSSKPSPVSRTSRANFLSKEFGNKKGEEGTVPKVFSLKKKEDKKK